MNTFERVKRVLVDTLYVSEQDITPQTSLAGDLAADSLYVVEALMALEQEFGIELDEEIDPTVTVQQIVDCIEARAACLR